MDQKTHEQWKLELLPQPTAWKAITHSKASIQQYKQNINKGKWMPGEEIHAQSKDWLYNSAKVLNKWVVNEEMTKQEFLAGLEKAATHYVR
jgi:hypothetical protein